MRRLIFGAGLSTVLALAAACTSQAPSTQAPASAAPGAVQAAKDAAAKAADGKQLGGTLNLLGLLSGEQLNQYLSTFKPFEDATGTTIKYETTADLPAVLQTRIAAGRAPDLVSDPSAGQLRQLATEGRLVPIGDWLDQAALRKDFPAGLIDLASTGGKLYGLFYNASVQNLIWYDPKTYDGPKPPADWADLQRWTSAQASSGATPWCLGVESGAASGWLGAAMIEQFVLRQSGTGPYDDWWQGKLRWTSPQVKAAFTAFGQISTDPKQVAGGPTAVLTTSFSTSPQGLYAKPPRCKLTPQAEWLGNTLAQTVPDVKAVDDIDFFTFPALDAANGGLLETSGEMLGAFKDSPQTRAFMRYLATPQFATLVGSTGQWLPANRGVSAEQIPSALSKKAAQAYAKASDVRYAAQSAMPPAMQSAFFKAVLDYVKTPSSLDQILVNLDEQQRAAYKPA
ncbi:ABC transporter substrate-binding protein [Dactylosporangium sp. NPDC051541]|uniref:ABC transporter substrate-binding protein n=1 Tax=Dactylosporangium sp. NPDC051541 TaxID=3363977 RepID=UPI00378B9322